jgi:hypothetical protein
VNPQKVRGGAPEEGLVVVIKVQQAPAVHLKYRTTGCAGASPLPARHTMSDSWSGPDHDRMRESNAPTQAE